MAIESYILGSLPLTINTTPYNKVNKSYSNNWAKQDRINSGPALQNTGNQSETMSISGVTLPKNSIASSAALVTIRELSETSTPIFLFNLDGAIHGKWVIKGFTQDESNGNETSYTLNLERYQEESIIQESKSYLKDLF